ncbi:patatin-like phospholipase family protein [Consotaella salsifontis]|uniref:NTE family protein n=1 Tax=Consotaella salsifontis TaxID=1365950 RepID=A0A1T4PYC3_9HYPH|nr:patatin-like phospholipase family protein [Consotaella salsifontis]SJZ96522.1 NTE family protein [Consotaella salsifontis]
MAGHRVGLALGGGGARGLAHIHVLKALDDLGIRPAAIAGTSIGAIMGALYAAGMSGAELGAYALENLSPARMAGKLWQTRPPSFADFVADGGFRLGQLNIERMLAAYLPQGLPESFETLPIPFRAVATDFFAGHQQVMDEGALLPALAASAAIPAVFRPVRKGDAILIDGGMTNPLPFDLLKDEADFILAVDVTGGPEGSAGTMPTPMQAIMGSSQLMMQSIIEAKLRIASPDLLIRPAVSKVGVLEFFNAARILAATSDTYDETRRSLEGALKRNAPVRSLTGQDVG